MNKNTLNNENNPEPNHEDIDMLNVEYLSKMSIYQKI